MTLNGHKCSLSRCICKTEFYKVFLTALSGNIITSIFFSILMMHLQKEYNYGCSSWFSYGRCLCNAGVEVLTIFCVLTVSSASDINLFRVVEVWSTQTARIHLLLGVTLNLTHFETNSTARALSCSSKKTITYSHLQSHT